LIQQAESDSILEVYCINENQLKAAGNLIMIIAAFFTKESSKNWGDAVDLHVLRNKAQNIVKKILMAQKVLITLNFRRKIWNF